MKTMLWAAAIVAAMYSMPVLFGCNESVNESVVSEPEFYENDSREMVAWKISHIEDTVWVYSETAFYKDGWLIVDDPDGLDWSSWSDYPGIYPSKVDCWYQIPVTGETEYIVENSQVMILARQENGEWNVIEIER